jgi:hypothetical protein
VGAVSADLATSVDSDTETDTPPIDSDSDTPNDTGDETGLPSATPTPADTPTPSDTATPTDTPTPSDTPTPTPTEDMGICTPVTPELYVNDPRKGATGYGPAGTAVNPFEPGITFACGGDNNDTWTLSFIGDQQLKSSVIGDATYHGEGVGHPADDIRISLMDMNGDTHTATATSAADLTNNETATVRFTAEGMGDIDRFSVGVDGAEIAWVAVYVQAGEGIPGDWDVPDAN